jgi:hypothetical protein
MNIRIAGKNARFTTNAGRTTTYGFLPLDRTVRLPNF